MNSWYCFGVVVHLGVSVCVSVDDKLLTWQYLYRYTVHGVHN